MTIALRVSCWGRTNAASPPRSVRGRAVGRIIAVERSKLAAPRLLCPAHRAFMTTPPRRMLRTSATCVCMVVATVLISPANLAAKPDKDEVRALKRAAAAEGLDPKAKPLTEAAGTRGDKKTSAGGSTESARNLDRLRERMEIADDAEWSIIAERIHRVEDARRSLWAASPIGTAGTDKRTGANVKSAHPERDALKSALGDRLPDAELSLRLARARDVHRENESRLLRAQADLRAVLTVRQEAVAVMAGLLPP